MARICQNRIRIFDIKCCCRFGFNAVHFVSFSCIDAVRFVGEYAFLQRVFFFRDALVIHGELIDAFFIGCCVFPVGGARPAFGVFFGGKIGKSALCGNNNRSLFIGGVMLDNTGYFDDVFDENPIAMVRDGCGWRRDIFRVFNLTFCGKNAIIVPMAS